MRDLVERSDGFADHGVGVMADLAIRHDVVGADQIEIVDLAARHELVDLDGAGGFKRDVFEFVLGDFEIAVGIDLVAFDDVFGGDFLAGIGVDLQVAYPVAGFLVDLVETDFFGFRRRGK